MRVEGSHPLRRQVQGRRVLRVELHHPGVDLLAGQHDLARLQAVAVEALDGCEDRGVTSPTDVRDDRSHALLELRPLASAAVLEYGELRLELGSSGVELAYRRPGHRTHSCSRRMRAPRDCSFCSMRS